MIDRHIEKLKHNLFTKDPVTFIIPVSDEEVFKNNFLSSPIFNNNHPHQIISQRGFRSAALAYNLAIESAENDLVVFIHQDVFLPEAWLPSLQQSLAYLDKKKINWGVLGCFGLRNGRTEGIGQVYTTGMGIHGRKIYKPELVETLDEIVLVIKKSSGLRFDQSLPHFHLYGTDICMFAREKGIPCYAIPAFCIHNTNQILNLPDEFYECYWHVKKQWKKYLPIYTSCIKISRFDSEVHLRRIHKVYERFIRKATMPVHRVADPKTLLDNLLKAD